MAKILDLYWDDGKEGCIVVLSDIPSDIELLIDIVKDEHPDDYTINDLLNLLETEYDVIIVATTCYSSNAPVHIEADKHVYF